MVSGDVEGAVEGVLYELSLGSLPMSGSRAVVDARTGRVTWVSFGGAAVGDEASPTRNQLGIRRARMRAIGAMASALLGEEVSGESLVEEEREEYAALETRFDGGAGGGDVRELVLRTVAESDRRAATGGAIPAGVVSLPFWSEDQRVRYHAMVYRSEEVIPGFAERLGGGDRGASPVVVERPAPRVETPMVDGRFGRLDKGAAVCGLPGEVNGPFERVRVLGRGKDGSAAFKDALQQALMQVNGATVASDERYSESITALMTNTELLEEVQSSQLLDVSVETNGAVLRFAECSPVREGAGGEFVADLVVDVLSYGDGEWRSVPTAAVVVLPIGQMIGSHADQLRRDILQQTAQDRADGALAGSGAYRALTRSKMLVLDQELQRVEDWVGAGESPMRELVILGQKLGSDRMLMVSVRRVEHDTQEVFVRVRNRTETQERLSVEVTVQEIVTATGEINASDTVRGYWTGAELDALKREFGVGPGLVSAAIERLVDRALSGVIGHSAEKRTGGLVVGHEEGTVYFRMSGGVWTEGEVLRVLAQAGGGGELFPVGEVVVEFVSGLTGTGRLVKGRAPEGAVLVKGGS